MKQIIGVIVTVCVAVACIVGYAVTHETIPPDMSATSTTERQPQKIT